MAQAPLSHVVDTPVLVAPVGAGSAQEERHETCPNLQCLERVRRGKNESEPLPFAAVMCTACNSHSELLAPY